MPVFPVGNESIIISWYFEIPKWFQRSIWPEVNAIIEQNDHDVLAGGHCLTAKEIVDIVDGRFRDLLRAFPEWFQSEDIVAIGIDSWHIAFRDKIRKYVLNCRNGHYAPAQVIDLDDILDEIEVENDYLPVGDDDVPVIEPIVQYPPTLIERLKNFISSFF